MSEGPAGLVLRLERDGVPWRWALPEGPPGGRGPALPAVPTTDRAVPGVRPWDSGRYAVEEWRADRVVVALAGRRLVGPRPGRPGGARAAGTDARDPG